MEPKKLAPLAEEDSPPASMLVSSASTSTSTRAVLPFLPVRPQSPSPSGRFTMRRSMQSNRSSFSASSASSSACSTAFVPPDPTAQSCVARETLKDDCATQRFIVWAAVKRNTCDRMKDDERLECPLLRCTRRFPDHEAMLRHLVLCDHLAYCEYWCYSHMRVERFDDTRCRKCLGHASKRRKMMSMAKHFFTAFGHNKGRGGDPGPYSSTSSAYLPAALSPAASMDFNDYFSRCDSNRPCESDRTSQSASRILAGASASPVSSASCASPSSSPLSLSSSAYRPPPMHTDITSTRVELPSTNMIAEIDSKEIRKPLALEPSLTETCPPAFLPTSVLAPRPPPEPLTSSIDPRDLQLSELGSMKRPSTEVNMPSISSLISDTGTPPASLTPLLDLYVGSESPCNALASGPSPSRPFLQLDTSTQNLQFLNQMESDVLMPPPRPPRPASASVPRSKNLSPSSSVRSTTSTVSTMSISTAASYDSFTSLASTATTMTAASTGSCVVSPISDCSGGSNPWSTGLETDLTSPTDDFTDLFMDELFTDSDQITGQGDYCDQSSGVGVPSGSDTASCKPNFGPNLDDLLFGLDTPMVHIAASIPAAQAASQNSSAPSGFRDYAASNNIISETPVEDTRTVPECSDAKAIMESTWDLLLAHIVASKAKLESSSNPLASALHNMSHEDIVRTGVHALRNALASGDEVMSPINTLCFLHVIYAFALVTCGQHAASQSPKLFGQAQSYARNFPLPDRNNYLETVYAVWKPVNMPSAASLEQARLHIGNEADALNLDLALENPAISTAKAFLDDLEISVILKHASMFDAQTSPLYQKHHQNRKAPPLSIDFVSSMKAILQTLLHEYARQASPVVSCGTLSHLISTGAVSSVRRLELELLQAGKALLGHSPVFFDSFVPRTRRLCDPLYACHESNVSQRAAYYDQSAAIVLSILEELWNTQVQENLAMGGCEPQCPLLCAEACLGGLKKTSFSAEETTEKYLAPEMKQAPDPLRDNTTELQVQPLPLAAVKIPAFSVGAGSGEAVGEKVEVESDDCCEICGYRPKGHPQWFRGSMAKHKKTKHSEEVTVYKCFFMGCNSQYRNRPDNLRQHIIEKNHWAGNEIVSRKHRRQEDGVDSTGHGEGTCKRPARPAKMKRVSAERHIGLAFEKRNGI